MSLKDQLQHIFHGDFPGIDVFVNEVVVPVFGNDINMVDIEMHNNPAYAERAKRANIKKLDYVADITDEKLNSGNIVLFDVTLFDNVNIERSRVNIQALIRSIVSHYSHVLMVFHYEDVAGRPWRFSYAYKQNSLADTTSARRFTYVFGKGFTGRTAAERFVHLAQSDRSDQDLQNAFSVEALSKEFFDRYRELYADFCQFITGKRYVKEGGKWIERVLADPDPQYAETFDDDDKLVRDYIKKMFGRIVFLYFLQRKGWLAGNPRYMHNLFANSSQKDNFLDGVLEPLFFEVLNTKNRTDAALALPGSNEIPYLNGGLFAQDDIDKLKCVFPEDYFKRLFDFLDSYNFTIDENDTDDAEVGIDPEMLGRIFENLLEDNKDKGAFYTPKEIVDYMCRESIIAYLQNEATTKEGKELIRQFVETQDAEPLSTQQKEYLHNKLKDVKICDPAIGSGAFPMGLVNLLSKLSIALGIESDTAVIKRNIIEKNIYGVDIEKGAVDIARLRFWLAMIVEEQTPIPLPNLHFKIMQGNSLVESYQKRDLKDLTKVKQQRSLFDSDNEERNSLRNLLGGYYKENDHDKRDKTFNSIINNVRLQLYDKQITLPEGLDPSANEEFFLWHTWFSDVFDKGGFDIVIGNPPYIQLQANGGALGKLYEKQGFETYVKTGDIYSLFYELGWQILKPNGHLCFITSNKWMRAGYGEKTRKFFAEKTNPLILLDFAGTKIFENATVDTNILLFEKAHNAGRTNTCIVKGIENLSNFVHHRGIIMPFKEASSWVILSPIEQSIKSKIEKVGTPLKDWDIQIYRGVLTGCNDAFIISTEKRNEILSNCHGEDEKRRTEELIRPILRGRDINRYSYNWADLWLIATFPSRHYDIEDYPAVKAHLLSFGKERLEQTGDTHIVNGEKIQSRKKTNNQWFETQDSISYWDDFNKPKIIYPNMTKYMPFVYDDKKFVTNQKCFIITGLKTAYLTAFFNSSLFKFCFRDAFPELLGGTREMSKIFFDKIPVKIITNDVEIQFQELVSDIQNEYTKEKAMNIDNLIFDIYNINRQEREAIGFIEIQ